MGLLKWLGLEGGGKKDPLELNDANFKKEVIRSDIPVIVDVWSPGCQPCTALAPTIMRLAFKYEGKVKVCHLNTANARRTAGGLGIRGTPTVLFFKNGAIVERVVGMRGQHYYEEIIGEDLLDNEAAGAAD